MAAVQLTEIVALQDGVVELQKREPLLPFQPRPHAVEAQHPVDAEMHADLPQQLDVAELVQPIRVVGYEGVGRPVPEADEGIEAALNPRHVGGDLRVGQQLPRLFAQRRVADPGGAATHQDYWAVPVALHQPQQHDLHQTADMQAVGGAVKADIARHRPSQQRRVKRVLVGTLEHETASDGFVQERAYGHGGRPHKSEDAG